MNCSVGFLPSLCSLDALPPVSLAQTPPASPAAPAGQTPAAGPRRRLAPMPPARRPRRDAADEAVRQVLVAPIRRPR